jgi:hypothetical protein
VGGVWLQWHVDINFLLSWSVLCAYSMHAAFRKVVYMSVQKAANVQHYFSRLLCTEILTLILSILPDMSISGISLYQPAERLRSIKRPNVIGCKIRLSLITSMAFVSSFALQA